MQTSIDYLPRKKRGELHEAVDIIREEVDVEMIILFGSYARGEWVEELKKLTEQSCEKKIPSYQEELYQEQSKKI